MLHHSYEGCTVRIRGIYLYPLRNSGILWFYCIGIPPLPLLPYQRSIFTTRPHPILHSSLSHIWSNVQTMIVKFQRSNDKQLSPPIPILRIQTFIMWDLINLQSHDSIHSIDCCAVSWQLTDTLTFQSANGLGFVCMYNIKYCTCKCIQVYG